MRSAAFALAAAGPLLLGALTLPISGAALAQAQKPAATKAQGAFSKAQLEQFANAAIDIYRVNTRHAARWRQTTEAAEKTKIQAEAKADQEAAVKKNGLTLQTYNDILLASKTDKALNDEIAAIIQAKTPG